MAAIARALDVHPAVVTRQRRMGMPVDSVEAARAWRAQHLSIAHRKPAPDEPPKQQPEVEQRPSRRDVARTSREEAEAEMAALAVMERRGQLVSREKVRAELGRRLAGLREALLQMPARMQSVLAAETDEAKVHDLLQDEIFSVLAHVAEAV